MVRRMACIAPPPIHKQIADALFILGGGQQSGIDGVIRPGPQRLQDLPFPGKGLLGRDALIDTDGMAAACLAITAHQNLIGCIQKQDFIGNLLAVQLIQRMLYFLPGAAAPYIHGQSHPLQLTVPGLGKRQDTGYQGRRDIIDAEKTDIFQCVHCNGFACTRHPADDQQLHMGRPPSLSCIEMGRSDLSHHSDFFFQLITGLLLYDIPYLITQSQDIGAAGAP